MNNKLCIFLLPLKTSQPPSSSLSDVMMSPRQETTRLLRIHNARAKNTSCGKNWCVIHKAQGKRKRFQACIKFTF